MASRPHSPASATVTRPDPGGQLVTEAGDDRPSPWWRMRSWRKDLDVLARLRDGLRAIPDDSLGDDQPEAASPPAGAASSGSQPGAPPGPSPEEAGPAARPGSAGPDPAIAAIRETFARTASAGDDAAAYFYASLFLRRPGLRELFPPAMDEQRDRLLTALTRIVESLSTPEEMAAYLTQLGRDHRKYAVEPAMYEVVGESLV